MTQPPPDPGRRRAGVAMGASAYLLWGVLPLYFVMLQPARPLEVLSHRIIWSALTCGLIVVAMRTTQGLRATVRDGRAMRVLAVASLLIAANWLIYVFAAMSGHVVEAALGYYINPLITVVLGVLVLKERLSTPQWISVAFAVVAVSVLTVSYGRLPWVALSLALTFGFYGLLKNLVGGRVTAVHSLLIETLYLLVPAFVVVAWLTWQGQATFTTNGPGHLLLMMAAGIITSVPLLLFGGAAARIPLSLVGLLQYLAPTMQFLVGVVVLGEQMTATRWVGFVLIWAALTVLAVSSRPRRSRRPAR